MFFFFLIFLSHHLVKYSVWFFSDCRTRSTYHQKFQQNNFLLLFNQILYEIFFFKSHNKTNVVSHYNTYSECRFLFYVFLFFFGKISMIFFQFQIYVLLMPDFCSGYWILCIENGTLPDVFLLYVLCCGLGSLIYTGLISLWIAVYFLIAVCAV